MIEKTKVIAVVHSNGKTAHPPGSNAVLFEVVEGGKVGTRGADYELFDIFGTITWDKSRVSIYETGQIRTAEPGEIG